MSCQSCSSENPCPHRDQALAFLTEIERAIAAASDAGFRIDGTLYVICPTKAKPADTPNPLPIMHSGTGLICKVCGGSHFARTGTCETCLDCGNNEGCG